MAVKEIRIANSYKKVVGFDISVEDAKKLLEDIIFYDGMFSFEDENLKAYRLTNVSVEVPKTLINYTSKVSDDVLGDYSDGFDQMFFIGLNELPELIEQYSTVEAGGDHTAVPVTKSETKSIKENNIPNENRKETLTMSNAVENLKKDAMQVGVGTGITTGTTADKKAALEAVKASKAARTQFSEGAKITGFAVSRVSRVAKAMDGKNAMGTVSNPEKAYNHFTKITGWNGESFANLADGQNKQDALDMLHALEAAKADPTYKMKPYFGANPDEPITTLKGIMYVGPNGEEGHAKYNDELRNLLLDKTLGYLNCSAKDGQINLKMREKKSSNPKARPYLMQIASKKELLDDAAFTSEISTITKEIADNAPTFKSEMAVKVKKVVAGVGEKVQTWRIPLVVEQFKVETFEQFKWLQGRSLGEGRTVERVDGKGVDALIGMIANILSESKAQGIGLSAEMNSQIAAAAATMEQANSEANAAALSGVGANSEDL